MASYWPSGLVLLVGHVFHPVDWASIDGRLNGDVAHFGVLGGAVPVLDSRFGPDHGASGDALLLAAPFLDPTSPGGDDERLSAGVGVPGSTRTRRERDLGRAERTRVVRVEQRLDVDFAGEGGVGAWRGRS